MHGGRFSFDLLPIGQFELDALRRDANRLTKEVKNLKIVSSIEIFCFEVLSAVLDQSE